MTSIHRDYISTESTSNNSLLSLIFLGLFVRALIGLVLGSIIFYVFEYRKKKHKQIETLDSLD